jgi:hypothetical protein
MATEQHGADFTFSCIDFAASLACEQERLPRVLTVARGCDGKFELTIADAASL